MLVEEDVLQPPHPLAPDERRVLGVMIEKALTTPDAYPITLNALVNGCNQKSNRAPVVSYDAEDVDQTLEGLQDHQLAATVDTAGGRTIRYRQLARMKFGYDPRQIAVMAELLLRGRQTLGELRQRASRMKAIESLDELRNVLDQLQDAGHVRATGPLNRRGVEVDHALYLEHEPEAAAMPAATGSTQATSAGPADRPTSSPEHVPPPEPVSTGRPNQDRPASPPPAAPSGEVADLREEVESCHKTIDSLRDEVGGLREDLETLRQDFEDFRSAVGG